MLRIEEIAALLDQIEQELRRLGYWGGDEGRPAEEAFLSTAPFCIDTMPFDKWLEYVLLARLRELMADGRPLPERMLTAPMAQEFWRGRWTEHKELIRLLKALDSKFAH